MSEIDTVLDRLRGEAELAHQGSFTLDGERAREKLRGAQLAEPRRWVVLLVRAAVMRGATRVDVRLLRDGLRIDFDGPPLARDELEGLWTGAFGGGERAATPALRELAVACNAALALAVERLEIRSASAAGSLAMFVVPGRPDRIASTRKPLSGTSVRLVERGGVLDRLFVTRTQRLEASALREACRFSPLAITVDGQRVSHGLAQLQLQVEGPIAPDVGGHCGFARADAAPEVIVLQHGVVLATRAPEQLPRGFVAIVDGSALRTDVSRSEPVEDELWQRIIAALHEAARGHLHALAQRLLTVPRHRADTEPWLGAVCRAQLATHGVFDPLVTDELVIALAELPLWRRADGRLCSTRELATRTALRYAETPDTAGVTDDVADVVVLDRVATAQLLSLFPDAVDASEDLRRAGERDRLRRLELQRAARPVAPPSGHETPRPLVSKTLPARARFLARPQVWSPRLGPLALGPVELTRGAIRCIVGIDAALARDDAREHARVKVLREQRVLTELKLRCPIPSVVAIVIDDGVAANAGWNGLADAADHQRVLDVLAGALDRLIEGVRTHHDAGDRTAKRVLAAAACAPFASALWLRAWRQLCVQTPQNTHDELARWLALAAAYGEAQVETVLRERLEHGRSMASASWARQLAGAQPGRAAQPVSTLQACALAQLDALWQLPLIARTRSFAAIEARPSEPGARTLHRWEQALVQQLFGESHAAAAIAPVLVSHAEAPTRAVSAETPPTVEPTTPASNAVGAAPLAAARDEPAHARAEPTPEIDASATASDDLVAEEVPVATRLLAAVLDELRAIRSLDPRVPADARMEQLELEVRVGPALAEARDHDVVLNAGHPVLRALLDAEAFDPCLLGFVVSAVYTVVNIALTEIADDDERAFVSAHARLIAARSPA